MSTDYVNVDARIAIDGNTLAEWFDDLDADEKANFFNQLGYLSCEDDQSELISITLKLRQHGWRLIRDLAAACPRDEPA